MIRYRQASYRLIAQRIPNRGGQYRTDMDQAIHDAQILCLAFTINQTADRLMQSKTGTAYSHFLLTRFNLRDNVTSDIQAQNSKGLTDAWLENRFSLFERFCLPSVCNQTNKDFLWLVFFDTCTPSRYIERIHSYENRCAEYKPVFIDGRKALMTEIQSIFSECPSPYIISSRLDNDDCIGANYIDIIQKHFNHQEFCVVDFLDGLILQLSPTVKLGKKLQLFNPFVSLIERNESPRSVLERQHGHWKNERDAIFIRGTFSWMAVIHQSNLANVYDGFGTVPEAVLDNFNLDTDIRQQIQQYQQDAPHSFRDQWAHIAAELKFHTRCLKRRLRHSRQR